MLLPVGLTVGLLEGLPLRIEGMSRAKNDDMIERKSYWERREIGFEPGLDRGGRGGGSGGGSGGRDRGGGSGGSDRGLQGGGSGGWSGAGRKRVVAIKAVRLRLRRAFVVDASESVRAAGRGSAPRAAFLVVVGADRILGVG